MNDVNEFGEEIRGSFFANLLYSIRAKSSVATEEPYTIEPLDYEIIPEPDSITEALATITL